MAPFPKGGGGSGGGKGFKTSASLGGSGGGFGALTPGQQAAVILGAFFGPIVLLFMFHLAKHYYRKARARRRRMEVELAVQKRAQEEATMGANPNSENPDWQTSLNTFVGGLQQNGGPDPTTSITVPQAGYHPPQWNAYDVDSEKTEGADGQTSFVVPHTGYHPPPSQWNAYH